MKVVHLSLSNDGGAGIAAYRLHTALCHIGIDSMMLTLHSKNDDTAVKVIDTTARPCLSTGPGTSAHFYVHEKRQHCLMEQHPHRLSSCEMFSDASSEVTLENIQELQDADIVNMHWITGVVDYARMGYTFRDKKIVWTLHAMNDFTGGCCYSYNCRKYTTSCTQCPQLGINPFDYAAHIFHQKLFGMQSLDVVAVTPSRWLADCAKQSAIFAGKSVFHIPNGISVNTFRPMESSLARQFLNISPDRFIILFGAFDASNERKGFTHLTAAFQHLSPEQCDKITVIGFGASSESLFESLPCEVKGLGPVCNEDNLALIYSMADLYVMPSLADNLPNSILESLSSGTPVVAFRVGGIPEIIQHKKNGYLATPFETSELAEGIVWCMQNRGQLSTESCTETIRYGYTERIQALRYISLYQSLLGG